jgi:hypothetical protein
MNSRLLLKIFFSAFLAFGIFNVSRATHLRAGEIIVERVSCNSLTFRITVTVFTNTINTNVLFGGEDDWLEFGDGTRMLVPETPNTLRPELGEGIATASFTVLHTYSGFLEYIVSYSEPNRNEGVVNMDGSVNTRFYIETKIIIDPFLGCNNTPKLLVPPIDRACTGVAWFHNPGAFDPDGDSISYEMVRPFRDKATEVVNYKNPNDPKFYTNPSTGSETGGPPSFTINPTDGTIVWDAPGMAGEYNIAFIIREWRNVAGTWISMGFVRRDMQIIVDECDNERPDLIVPEDVCVVAGSILNATILGIDPDNDNVKLEAFSEIFNFPTAQSPATYQPNPPIFQPTNPEGELTFKWQTNCGHVKEQPYQVVFKVTDQSPGPRGGSRLVTFKTWFIKVVGPEPDWTNAQVNPATRTVNLTWQNYECQNAELIEVWRRVDSFAFEPDSCQTGMPEFLGYNMIATVPASQSTYLDKGLNAGAQYCYRLVARFPKPRGGESYVSDEICTDPILVDEPIITNVSIDKTSTTDGQITVRWTKPFELDRQQFPKIEYEIFRAESFAGNTGLKKVGLGRNDEEDTVFVDVGMNTRDIVYNYRIVLYANSATDVNVFAPLDTSATASTVRLAAQSELNKIILNWSAVVPWSNIILTEPNEHEVYRGPTGSTEATIQLIASIDPTTEGLTYVDEGQHNGVPLKDTEEYCYRIMTRGAYGNPGIKEPLINYSQIICAQPNDSIPPCIPRVTIQLSDCEKFLAENACGGGLFTNVVTWERADDDCAEDIRGYKVYRAASADGEFVWLNSAGPNKDGIIMTNRFDDEGLTSLAYCYRVSAIDKSNNESELSEPVCNDNCPYYELPNVFTPNSDECNRYFSAYSDRNIVGEESICPPTDFSPKKCARFVKEVQFRVYNRWGKEIYSYRGASNDDRNSIYIDWDGRGTDGTELSAGIYYYAADVTFDSVDPAKQNQTIKGWVHLIR